VVYNRRIFVCMVDNTSIKALIRLIDDPDESIYNHVHDRLLRYGPVAIPFLESSWEDEDYGLVFQDRIENLIHEIQFEDIKNQLRYWTNSEHKDLLEGAIIVAKYQYPNLDKTKILEDIKKIKDDIWLEISNKHTAYEKVRVFNKVFFNTHNFHGNSKDFHSPLNSFINTVLETRRGNPLSLSILYSIIAQSLELPVYGVNLPNHFILAYVDENGTNHFIKEKNDYGVLFYINTFSRGNIFDETEIKEFLKSINFPFNPEYFEPCSNTSIVNRMLTNLITSFQRVGNEEKVKELTELRNIFTPRFLE
jgi:regulator of sirC expression with transglutaminase-like and TPR domain